MKSKKSILLDVISDVVYLRAVLVGYNCVFSSARVGTQYHSILPANTQ